MKHIKNFYSSISIENIRNGKKNEKPKHRESLFLSRFFFFLKKLGNGLKILGIIYFEIFKKDSLFFSNSLDSLRFIKYFKNLILIEKVLKTQRKQRIEKKQRTWFPRENDLYKINK